MRLGSYDRRRTVAGTIPGGRRCEPCGKENEGEQAHATSPVRAANTRLQEQTSSPNHQALSISAVRGDAGDGFAEDQRVDVVRSLVGLDRLEVAHVAHHRVLAGDAVGPEDIPSLTGDVEGDFAVVAL